MCRTEYGVVERQGNIYRCRDSNAHRKDYIGEIMPDLYCDLNSTLGYRTPENWEQLIDENKYDLLYPKTVRSDHEHNCFRVAEIRRIEAYDRSKPYLNRRGYRKIYVFQAITREIFHDKSRRSFALSFDVPIFTMYDEDADKVKRWGGLPIHDSQYYERYLFTSCFVRMYHDSEVIDFVPIERRMSPYWDMKKDRPWIYWCEPLAATEWNREYVKDPRDNCIQNFLIKPINQPRNRVVVKRYQILYIMGLKETKDKVPDKRIIEFMDTMWFRTEIQPNIVTVKDQGPDRDPLAYNLCVFHKGEFEKPKHTDQDKHEPERIKDNIELPLNPEKTEMKTIPTEESGKKKDSQEAGEETVTVKVEQQEPTQELEGNKEASPKETEKTGKEEGTVLTQESMDTDTNRKEMERYMMHCHGIRARYESETEKESISTDSTAQAQENGESGTPTREDSTEDTVNEVVTIQFLQSSPGSSTTEEGEVKETTETGNTSYSGTSDDHHSQL
jgi:hypothetical protein